MHVLLEVLAGISFLGPVVTVTNRCINQGKIRIDHIFCFSLGFIIYWVAPMVCGILQLFHDLPGMSVWYGIFDAISQTTQIKYLVICCVAYGTFIAGDWVGRHSNARHGSAIRFDPKFLTPFMIIGALAAAVFAFTLRGELFKGYTTGSITIDMGYRGTFVATTLILFSIALLRLSAYETEQPSQEFFRRLREPYFIIYFAAALLVLSLGGRLYLLSTILSLMAYRTVIQERPVRLTVIAIGGSIILATVSIIGLLRTGSSHFTIIALVFNIAAEPLFTSFSLIHYLRDASFALIHTPIFLFGELANLIPSAILPNKAALMITPEDYGYTIFAPVGALNSFFLFMINFGVLGTLVVLFAMGWGTARLQKAARGAYTRTAYVMLTGWFTFTFFRDPFSVSLVKNMLEFSLIVPGLLIILIHVATIVGRRKSLLSPQQA